MAEQNYSRTLNAKFYSNSNLNPFSLLEIFTLSSPVMTWSAPAAFNSSWEWVSRTAMTIEPAAFPAWTPATASSKTTTW
jgi:hypothetical protein